MEIKELEIKDVFEDEKPTIKLEECYQTEGSWLNNPVVVPKESVRLLLSEKRGYNYNVYISNHDGDIQLWRNPIT